MSEPGELPDTPGPGEPARSRTRVAVVTIVILALITLVVVLISARDGDDDAPVASTPSGTDQTVPDTTTPGSTDESTVPPGTTSAPSTTGEGSAPPTTAPATAPPTTVPDADVALAVWPTIGSGERIGDPVEAAERFAIEFLGFVDPVVSEFMAGDQRSGEVAIQAFEGGPVTTVFVRLLGADEAWWVLGAACEGIVVDEPEPLAAIDSPLTVSGRARAFEGTVEVEIRADDVDEPLFSGFVTGSGSADLGPFESEFEWDDPGEGAGSMVFVSRSAEDGTPVEAGVFRVFFGEAPG